jgi:ubiquinone/menaquinone biosynthesis C-methylase UbiE
MIDLDKVIDLDKLLSVSAKEVEDLQWYDLMSRLGLQTFNLAGFEPIEFIAKQAHITEESTVLMVGCGAGGTSVHLAETTGATIYGIDIALESITRAKALAANSFASTRLHFEIEDAHAIRFPPNMFDLVVIEYMAYFLRPEAFDGFYRVLKPMGQIALAEMMKDSAVIPKADEEIMAAEKVYSELLGYQFRIPMISEYAAYLNQASFIDVRLETRFARSSLGDSWKIIGGWKSFFRMSKAIIRLMWEKLSRRISNHSSLLNLAI